MKIKLSWACACAFVFGLGLASAAIASGPVSPPGYDECVTACMQATCPGGLCSEQQYLYCQVQCR
ncbi:hypothetical protein [Oleiagrimonas soli]|uniref:Kazal-like domain-containing protein n=1 Tax=Oleiagrimonas soli TaxID=1543381 RepID=A0A099CUH5_9GAMM|nr:hypothetical protein [Oleiagrimonas soli]KGI76655.1 hypothetical protein LF63_0113850 [Oleiagrimonas soli]MBB6185135.1 hypothetical protein [Oleiagrimonas soli]